jgi:hypothetical protein
VIVDVAVIVIVIAPVIVIVAVNVIAPVIVIVMCARPSLVEEEGM